MSKFNVLEIGASQFAYTYSILLFILIAGMVAKLILPSLISHQTYSMSLNGEILKCVSKALYGLHNCLLTTEYHIPHLKIWSL